jgi:peptidoglycan/xylan/chitin deacetylase (PgdA/CDA1 family)
MGKQALISLTFDDGLRCQFERALPILNQYGFPATFFLTANQDSTHEPWYGHTNDWWKIDWREEDISTLKKTIQAGHEIGSHSVTHNLDKMPKQPEIEARKSKELIDGWIGTKVSSFSYPYYRSHAYLADAVKNAGYEQARGGGIRGSYIPQASYYTIPDDGSLDRFNVDCRQISKNEDVGGWVRPGCWHVLTFHGIGVEQDGWAPITVDQFATQMAELAKHRDAGAVEVVTFKDGAGRLRSDSSQI